MFDFLIPNKTWPIALDLGSDSIKMLQMSRMGSTVKVSACGRWRYPSTAVAAVERDDLAVAAIGGMLKGAGFRGRKVVSALSCDELSIKNIRLPHLADSELRQAVAVEAHERFGMEMDDDQLGLLNAGQIRQGTETRDEILMLAASREVVDRHLNLLERCGLVPLSIEAEPLALFRGFERFLRRRSDEQAVSVLIDLGRRASRVVISRGRQIVFIKSIDVGGQKFTEAVARQVNISAPEAYELRLRVNSQASPPREAAEGTAPQGADRSAVNWTIRDAVRSEVEALGKEVALCLRYCSVTFRGLRPDRIVVTGGEAYDQAVVELLSEHLGIPCIVGQPLKGVDVSTVNLGADRRAMLAEWAVCAGLAGRYAEIPTVQEGQDGNRRLSA